MHSGESLPEYAMKILVADKMEQWGLDQLKGLADELAYEPDLKDDALKQRLAEFDPDVMTVRSTKVPKEIQAAAKNLKLIVRAGSGFDTIDVKAAAERNIRVCNCPGMNAVAVAELAFGLILALDRRIPDNVADLRAHNWKKKFYAKAGKGLKGRTLGVIGAGRIGAEVAKRALAFDMHVLYYHIGRQLELVDHPNARRAGIDDLLRQSDIVTIHVPGGGGTKHLIDARRLALMRPDALLINTSRAGVIDEEALVRALREGKLRGAGLDVYANEPAAEAKTIDSIIVDLPNFYGTHHIGASTEQAQLAVAEEVVRIVSHFKNTGEALHCVNMEQPLANPVLIVEMDNKPGGLAHVFEVLGKGSLNALEMDQVVYDNGQAACAHIRLDKPPTQDVLERIRTGHPAVRGVEVIEVA
jgi:D-3-phosphoglycerate dehydrogenase